MSEIATSPAAPARRECGSCGMCCKLFHIPAVDKPAGKWCRHWASGAGCAIHPDRPDQCREFFCLWMTDPNLAEAWKPDRSRIVLSIFPGNGFVYAQVEPSAPQAWRKQPYFDDLRRMATALAEANRRVIVFVGEQATLITARGATPLGRMSREDSFVLEPAFGPDGPTVRLAGLVKRGQA